MDTYSRADHACTSYNEAIMRVYVNDDLLSFREHPEAMQVLRDYKEINRKLEAILRSFINPDEPDSAMSEVSDVDVAPPANLASSSDSSESSTQEAAQAPQPRSFEIKGSSDEMDIDPISSTSAKPVVAPGASGLVHRAQARKQSDTAGLKGKAAVYEGLKVAVGAPDDDPGYVFVHVTYSDYGMNGLHKPNSPAMQEAIHALMASLPDRVFNILKKNVPAKRIRLFLFDGVKGNMHFELLDKVRQNHIPKGSRAGDYLRAFEELKPSHVIALGVRATSTCKVGLKWFFEKVHAIVPNVIFHYPMRHGGERFTAPDISPADMLNALNARPEASEDARDLVTVIGQQSLARVEIHVGFMRSQLKGSGIQRNDLAKQPSDGNKKSIRVVMTRFNWPQPKACSTVIKDHIHENNKLGAAGCDKALVSDEDMLFHLISEHFDVDDPQSCIFCGEHFVIPSQLCRHLAGYLMTLDRECPHADCVRDATFGFGKRYNMYTLQTHQQLKHNNPKLRARTREQYAAESEQHKALSDLMSTFPGNVDFAEAQAGENAALSLYEQRFESVLEDVDDM